MKRVKIGNKSEMDSVRSDCRNAGFDEDVNMHFRFNDKIAFRIETEADNLNMIVISTNNGYVFQKIKKNHGCFRDACLEFYDYLTNEARLESEVSELEKMRNEIEAITEETGIKLEQEELANDEVRVHCRASYGLNRTNFRVRAYLAENSEEVRWFPHECRIHGSVWAVAVKRVEGYGLKAVGIPRMLKE